MGESRAHRLRVANTRCFDAKEVKVRQVRRSLVGIGVVHAILFSLLPANAACQSFQGRLLQASDQEAINGGVVQLVDSAGRLLGSAMTSSSGSFVLRTPGAGSYRLRGLAVGFKPAESGLLRHEGGRETASDLLLDRAAVVLGDLVVRARKGRCANAESGDAVFASLLEGAATSMTIMDAMLTSGTATFETEVVEVRKVSGTMTSDTTKGKLLSWPFLSLDPDSLKANGFHRFYSTAVLSSDTYYAPDARVLFAPWFLASHCFTLRPFGPEAREITVAFAPRRKGVQVDISGELVLDAELFTPRRLSYRHLYLPRGLPDNSSGGEVKFMALGGGLWLPINWRMWAPVPPSLDSPDRSRALGRAERFGRVTKLAAAPSKESP